MLPGEILAFFLIALPALPTMILWELCVIYHPKKWINPQLLGYLLTRANLWDRIPSQVPEWITIQPVLAMIACWKDISHFPKNQVSCSSRSTSWFIFFFWGGQILRCLIMIWNLSFHWLGPYLPLTHGVQKLQDILGWALPMTRSTHILDIPQLGGGFKYVLFSPLFGEDSHFG